MFGLRNERIWQQNEGRGSLGEDLVHGDGMQHKRGCRTERMPESLNTAKAQDSLNVRFQTHCFSQPCPFFTALQTRSSAG